MLRAGRALKGGTAVADVDHEEVQRFRDGGVGDVAAQHGAQHVDAAHAGHLIRARHARAGPRVQAPQHLLFFGQPGFQHVGSGHGLLLKKLYMQSL
ncbi:hypothetical protein D3C85_1565970 [compost metagenome]